MDEIDEPTKGNNFLFSISCKLLKSGVQKYQKISLPKMSIKAKHSTCDYISQFQGAQDRHTFLSVMATAFHYDTHQICARAGVITPGNSSSANH